MPLENTGKQITKIKINKKKVTLTFLDKSKLDISYHAYSESYLFVGKILSNKDIKKLKDDSALDEALTYALSIVKKRIISEYALREKLYKKEYPKYVIDNVITFLKNNDLINDKMFILDYIEYANEALISKNKIKNDLKAKGIFEENLNKINFSHSNELRKAKALLPTLEKKYKNLNYENKKKHIYECLLRRGFDIDVTLETIKNIKSINIKDELVKLNKAFDEVIIKAKRKDFDNKEFHQFVLTSLLRKGYKLKDIKMKLEEYYEINR